MITVQSVESPSLLPPEEDKIWAEDGAAEGATVGEAVGAVGAAVSHAVADTRTEYPGAHAQAYCVVPAVSGEPSDKSVVQTVDCSLQSAKNVFGHGTGVGAGVTGAAVVGAGVSHKVAETRTGYPGAQTHAYWMSPAVSGDPSDTSEVHTVD